MLYKEYGCADNKKAVLLHGGGLSWWGYEAVAKILADKYHVILPVLDGHGDSMRDFISIEDNAADIIKFIDENFGGHIDILGGLSLGGQIAVEILSQRKDICNYAFIESALVIPSKLTDMLVSPMIKSSYWLINKPWFARLQFDYLKMPKELFDRYYEDSCKITEENMISFLKANSSYSIKPSLKDTAAQVVVMAGRKEQGSIKKSAQLLNNTIAGSSAEIIDGMYHGQLSMNYPEKYISILNKYIK